ncbi:ATP-binding protein [Pseudovibrio sp. Tun.PSC04-5.I4]|uniref:ATP-binding protein n=1 Tax=Pseudovibrio sp. Tun.PSC04-5.I4 TaxID=1798213 RepID=UPI00088CF222|nr:ATP-binding protein [Pseudovibrio sp. Tun.PSC04-5.I4]SDR38394.1 TMAO reductase sytem sensor TorS [Pseudovibrio sp. Tun.PSC04-5.I4]
MDVLRTLILQSENSLIDRIFFYAKNQGYTQYTATLREAWRASITGLSSSIIEALDTYDHPPEIPVNADFSTHPIAAFGVEQARSHRSRGVTLGYFLGLTKYYRKSYLDLVDGQSYEPAQIANYHAFLHRYFDFMELGFSTEWCSVTESDKLNTAYEENRRITNDKNKYLTILESLSDPIVLLNEDGSINDFNYATQTIFTGLQYSGAKHKNHSRLNTLTDQLRPYLPKGMESCFTDVQLDTASGPRFFDIRAQQMADFSEKYFGLIVILNDVTDHKKAREEAEAANNAKSTFLAAMSHEIRTPLNGVLGLADLLKDTELGQDQLRYLSGIVSSGEMLRSILNDVLDYSKIEAGSLELETVDFKIRQVVEQVENLVAQDAEKKALSLNIHVSKDVPDIIRADPTKIRQVLLNLVSNAVKFTDVGSVSIQVAIPRLKIRHTNCLQFTVTDTGIGLPSKDASYLFEPFVQQNASTNRLFGGSGLGLAISKRLVTAMGGEIGCQPNAEAGSIFRFSVPFYETDQSVSMIDDRKAIWKPKKLKVLLVEDNEVNQLVTEGFLEKLGHTSTTVSSGEDALQKLNEHRYDLVLMDNRMPGLSGIDSIAQIRASKHFSIAEIPVIVQSACIILAEIERSFAVGADGFLGKPYTQDELEDAIASCLSDRAMFARNAKEKTCEQLTELIDVAVVHGHYNMLGEARARRIIEAYMKSTLYFIPELRNDIAAKNFCKIENRAHGMKGASHNVGLIHVAHLSQSLEHAANNKEEHKVMELFGSLEIAFTASKHILNETWLSCLQDAAE